MRGWEVGRVLWGDLAGPSRRGLSGEPGRGEVCTSPPSLSLHLLLPSSLFSPPPPLQTFESTGGLPTEAVLSLMTALGEVSAKCLPTQVGRRGGRKGLGGRTPAHNAGVGVANVWGSWSRSRPPSCIRLLPRTPHPHSPPPRAYQAPMGAPRLHALSRMVHTLLVNAPPSPPLRHPWARPASTP